MNQDEYINNRLDDQISWYDKKSLSFKNKFRILRISEIIFAAAIPLISTFPDTFGIAKMIMAGLGAIIVVIESINALNKYQELWINYRTTAETLKHHKYLFITKSTPYDISDAFNYLVKNVESIISHEHSNWTNMLKKQQGKMRD